MIKHEYDDISDARALCGDKPVAAQRDVSLRTPSRPYLFTNFCLCVFVICIS
jgi:hypothetical protein